MADKKHITYGPRLEYHLPDVPLGEYLLRCLREHGNKPCQRYIDAGKVLTFSQLADLGCSVATELRARGIGEGDVVSVCTGVCPEFTQIMLGTLFIGATVAPLNSKFDENDFNLLLTLLEPRIIFTTPESAERLESVLSELNIPTELVVLEEQNTSWRKFLDHKVGPDFQTIKQEDFEEKLALIMCSSGTTGLPKGVMITHRGILCQIAMFQDGKDLIKLDDKILTYSSPFWISGPIFYFVGMALGLELLLGKKFEDELFLKAVHEHKATLSFLPPNQAVSVAKCSAVDKYDLSSLRFLICAGAAMSKESQILVQQSLKKSVCQGFGMTEAMIVLTLVPEDGDKEGSSGKPVRNTECKIVDLEIGQAVGPNIQGELCIKCPTLFKGYYRNPEATAEAFDNDGWLHSGDIAYYDEEGFFYIVDRYKDLIKYRGNHVAPVEIESHLLDHPGVKSAAVFGIKHELDQEHPMAVVIKQPGSKVTEEELIRYVEGNLAEHKWIRAGVLFVDELPTTPSGKIQRRKVRIMYEASNGVGS